MDLDEETVFESLVKYKNNVVELKKSLENVEWQKVQKLLDNKLMTSAGLNLLEALFSGFGNSSKHSEIKFKVILHTLKLLRSSEINFQINVFTSSLQAQLSTLHKDNLKILSQDLIETIEKNSDPHICWKDLLPECLSLLASVPDTVSHNGSDVSASEYVSQCIKHLCFIPWDPTIITPMATMFRDMEINKEDLGVIENKLCCDLDKLNPESLPPLLYQLIRLHNEETSPMVYFKFSEYFSTRLYPELRPENVGQDSESPNLDLIGVEQPDESAWNAHATCIQFAAVDSSISRKVLSLLRSASKRPPTLLSSPTLLHLLLAAERQRSTCLPIIRATLTNSLMERQKREEFTWCANTLSAGVPLEALVKSLVVSSTKHCHLSTVGLLHLGVSLISSCGKIPPHMLPKPYLQLKALGRLLIVRLGRAFRNSIPQALKMLMHSPQLITELIESLCINAGPMMMDCIGELRHIVEECLCYEHDPSEGDTVTWRSRILQAVVPITTRASHLRDTFFIMCRKGLFSRDPSVGRVAVVGLLSLLKALRCSSDSLSQDTYGSEHTVLTQISIDVHHTNAKSRVNNSAVCTEVISHLRMCLNQSWEVREQLYKGCPGVISKRPELCETLLELLYVHMSYGFINLDTSCSTPIHINKCVHVRDDSAVLLEPIGDLIFCIQKLLTSDLQDASTEMSENRVCSNKLLKRLHMFAEKFANKTPTDFGLDDGLWLSDILPESRGKYLEVQQILQVCEGLIAFTLHHWGYMGDGGATKTLHGLHKTYSSIIDFVKTNSKGKKNDKNTSVRQNDKDCDAAETSGVSKGKKSKKGAVKLADMRKEHGIVFKPLNTVWDIDTVLRVVQLLYDNSVEATHMENIQTNQNLHRHFMKSCVNSVKTNSGHTAQSISVAKILYTRCISRLDDFSDFDSETALLVVECFQEILNNIFSHDSTERLNVFLKELGGENELGDTSSYISHLCVCIGKQVIETSGGEGESKIPSALLKLLITLLNKLPSNTAICDKWTEWFMELSADKNKFNWVGGICAIACMLNLSARSRNPWVAIENLVAAFTSIIRTHDTDSDSTQEEYEGMFGCLYKSPAALSNAFVTLCTHLTKRLSTVELVIARLKAEQMLLPYKSHAVACSLRNHERELCGELCHIVSACRDIAGMLCPAGPCCTSAIKLISKLYTTLALTAQHFTQRDITAVTNARFETLIKASGRKLIKNCDALIEHVESVRSGQKKDTNTVSRDTRLLPKMVYLMEQFDKKIMLFDKKLKLNFMQYMSKSNSRDFKIKMDVIHEVLKNDEDGEGGNDGVEDVTQESLHDEVESIIKNEYEGDDDGGSSKRNESDASSNSGSDSEGEDRTGKRRRIS